MLNGKTVAVVIPCYNEETQIAMVLDSMPDFVDKIFVIDDKSKDKTSDVIKRYIDKSDAQIEARIDDIDEASRYSHAKKVVRQLEADEVSKYTKHEIVNLDHQKDRVVFIKHIDNGGVGAAIATGYYYAKIYQIDCTAVMAGDGQMDPEELESICSPVANEGIDYVKGNRLIHRSAWLVVPKVRYIGNSILSLLTKIASGYWNISDTQTGYTCISLEALRAIRIYNIYKSYGMPNDILVKLNIAYCTIREVKIKPVYNVGEQSKMKVLKVIPTVSYLLLKSFIKRLWIKYLFRDFHPLFLLYHFSFILSIANIVYLKRFIYDALGIQAISTYSLIIFIFLSVSSFQTLFFSMWMDVVDNERLNK